MGVASGEGASTSKGTYIINAIYRTKTDVIFTSGATESNNIALKGIAYRKKQFANEIITSVLEHPSVLEVMRYLEEDGFVLKYVDVNADGRVDIEHLAH